MSSVVVDTHAAIWYFVDPDKLSPAALQAIEDAGANGEPVFLPSVSLVEMRYLVEKCKILPAVLDRINAALDLPNANFQVVSLDLTIDKIPRDEVPDMPDRIIAATAFALQLPLVTRDHKIQSTSIQTIW